METEILACPVCGTPMNHHANKLIYGAEQVHASQITEVLEEFHRCPRCGAGVSRTATFDISPD